MLSNWYPWLLLTPNNYVLMMLSLQILYLLKMFILRKLEIIWKETSSREIQGQLTGAKWTRLGKNINCISKVFAAGVFANFLHPAWSYSTFGLRGWNHLHLYSTYCVTGSAYRKIWFSPFQCDFCCSKIFFLQILGRFWPLTTIAKWQA